MSEQSKQELRELIQGGENLTVEFKGDWSGNKMAPSNPGLSDKDLTEALIALANTEGGFLLLGVEDDGSLTDVRTKHQDEKGLMARYGGIRWWQDCWLGTAILCGLLRRSLPR